MSDDDIWFEPKRYGYGAGLPVRWQGWALILGYSILLLVAGLTLMPAHPIAFAIIVVASTAALLATSAAHTRGGWRWRNGDDD